MQNRTMLVYIVTLQLELEPTRQVLTYARSQGYGNVHDFLVHLVTGKQIRGEGIRVPPANTRAEPPTQ
jgi:hypothetical protein